MLRIFYGLCARLRNFCGLYARLRRRQRVGNTSAVFAAAPPMHPAQRHPNQEEEPMSNQNSQQKIPDVENQYRVAALARVNQMHDDLINANAVINQLRVDLNREHDRVTLTLEERDRYRHEAVRMRKLLIELTTQMANIGLLTRKAEECVSIISEMDAA